MLELLSKSKIRQKIILLFVYNQNKEYYLSEIARAVETSPGTAQRELNRLLQNDLIVFKKKAGINIYALNKRYSLLAEIQAIITKTFGVEEELRKRLKKMGGVSFVFLFGSYAKGGFKSDSDIDLFVIGNPDPDLLFESIREVEKKIGRDVNCHFADKKEFTGKLKTTSFYKEIVKKYILLIGDKDEFRRFTRSAS